MKKMARFAQLAVLLGALAALPATPALAQKGGVAARVQQAMPATTNAANADAQATRSEEDEYRHSASVKAIAHFLHVNTETMAQIFEDLNSGLLIGAILIVLAKVLPGVFRNRSQAIGKDLMQARTATEEANRRLAEVEARLSRLDSEIESIRQQAEKDAAEDEKRILAAMELERERIVASAEQEIAAAQSAAQRELKKFAADLAIDNAMQRIQLSAETDRALVKDFGTGLPGGKA